MEYRKKFPRFDVWQENEKRKKLYERQLQIYIKYWYFWETTRKEKSFFSTWNTLLRQSSVHEIDGGERKMKEANYTRVK